MYSILISISNLALARHITHSLSLLRTLATIESNLTPIVESSGVECCVFAMRANPNHATICDEVKLVEFGLKDA